METIRGRTSLDLDWTEIEKRLNQYTRILLDLGTGDGRFVHRLAGCNPDWFVIGVDPCRENLLEVSRAGLPNMLFIIASVQSLPAELNGLASQVTINFPWGSLLDGLLAGDARLLQALESTAAPAASLDIRLNGSALAEAGWLLEAGTKRIHDNLDHAGWHVGPPTAMNAGELREFPTTWAKRLAFGRDPRATRLSCEFAGRRP
jgi:16S rRNA (adenine(1408)-N(1))-methyltransferase